VINSIATLSGILKSKEVGLSVSLYGGLPESSIGEKIYKLRKIHGLGLEAFAERIEGSVTAIRSWEDNSKIPSKTSLGKICSAFDMDISYFGIMD
jgi:DNA-binding XRE family transcriptional regulator